MLPVPVNDPTPARGPHPTAAHHGSQSCVQVADAERLTAEPGVQVQHEQPSVVPAIAIELLETVDEQGGVTRDGHVPLSHGVEVIELQHERQREQLALGRLYTVRLLVIGPVTYIANTGLGQ
jgi:hypothetical protein